MILTVTMNPSVDISYPLDSLKTDTVNRVENVTKTAGGKGLNVTRVLAEYGEEVTATGLVGGKNGEYLLENLPKEVKGNFYRISGNTRNCIAILHDDGQQTEILEKGPNISEAEGTGFLKHFEKLVKECQVVAISGSLPAGLPVNFYVELIRISNKHDKKVVLDSSGKSLEAVLKSDYKPTIIKPNNEELSQLLNESISKDINELKDALKNESFNGIEWIIVSLGSEGCLAKHNNKFYKVDIPKIEVVNPVGSGDSTVAGISAALNNKKDDYDLLRIANVLGMLNAQEHMTGHVNMDNFEKIFNKIKVKEV